MEERILASNESALVATQGGAGIGKQSTGARRDYREERILASNPLALDATIGRSGYWQAMNQRWTEERVLTSNPLALDATGYKRDLARDLKIARLWRLLGDSAIRQLPAGRGMREYTEGVGETCSVVKQGIDVARHGDTCNTACASSFSDDNQWEFTHQWSANVFVTPVQVTHTKHTAMLPTELERQIFILAADSAQRAFSFLVVAQRVHSCISHIFNHTPLISLSTVPVFSKLTHLEILNDWVMWSSMVGLEHLQQLTHLCLHVHTKRTKPTLVMSLLRNLPLQVLVFHHALVDLDDFRNGDIISLWQNAEQIIEQRHAIKQD
ncbi:hypothetical protein BD769DRAFT_1393337 [Suillus cothurnatus]|nr:hypothetical protein BD769DRAFT_1393337 [Suillus cothurnatus]